MFFGTIYLLVRRERRREKISRQQPTRCKSFNVKNKKNRKEALESNLKDVARERKLMILF